MNIEFRVNGAGMWNVVLIVGNDTISLARNLPSYGDCQQFWIDLKAGIDDEPIVRGE